MARITKSDTAPSDLQHFSLAQVEFDLTRKNSVYETDDPAVIANARTNPQLVVEEDAPSAAPVAAVSDVLDPHQNPSADHLSALASPAAVAAANANEAAIREAAGLDDSFGVSDGAPTIAETLQATFDVVAPSATPEFPADAADTATAPEADQPGGGVSTPAADADASADTTTDAPSVKE